jgi:carbonic anhydrase
MVVGHYGCSGVQAALEGARVGLADNWLRHIQDVRDRHWDLLSQLDERHRAEALCELNVITQVANVSQSTVLLDAWARGQNILVHGWIYGLRDGLLKDLMMTVSDPSQILPLAEAAIAAVAATPRH